MKYEQTFQSELLDDLVTHVLQNHEYVEEKFAHCHLINCVLLGSRHCYALKSNKSNGTYFSKFGCNYSSDFFFSEK